SPKRGAVRPITQEIAKSSRIRVSIASPSPRLRARACWAWGSFPERIDMKMMLSIPRTTSNTVRVSSATHVSGLESHSMAAKRTCHGGIGRETEEPPPEGGGSSVVGGDDSGVLDAFDLELDRDLLG